MTHPSIPTVNRRRLMQSAALATFLTHQANAVSAGTHDDPVSSLVAGTSAFARDLYESIRETTDDNIVFSPFSVSLALAMTWAGAEGETADQMADTLGFDLDPEALAASFRDLSDDLVTRGTADDDPDEGVTARTLRIANAIWGEQTFPFSDTYLNLLEDQFASALHQVDFVNAAEDARNEINAWVADQTEDRITDIVPEGIVDEMTRLVLANAIWFYGGWARPFEPESTEDDDFTLLDGNAVSVPFMRQTESLRHVEGDGHQIVELPYGGSGFGFAIVLPDDFEAFEAALDIEEVISQLDAGEQTRIRLSLPRFEFDFDAALASALQGLGIVDAFDDELADFSGMVDGELSEPLVIGDVLHKAFISVDEEGTEAAAATAVVMEVTSAPIEPDPIEVRIDRPFLFAIRDVETGTLLFLGRVLDPTA